MGGVIPSNDKIRPPVGGVGTGAAENTTEELGLGGINEPILEDAVKPAEDTEGPAIPKSKAKESV